MTPTTVAVELSRRWLNSTATLQLATVANKPSPLNIHRYPLQIANTHSKLRPFAFLQTGDDLTSGDPSHSLPSPKPSSPSWRFARFRSRQFIRFTIAKTQLQLATVANKSSSSPSPSFRRNRDDSAPKRFRQRFDFRPPFAFLIVAKTQPHHHDGSLASDRDGSFASPFAFLCLIFLLLLLLLFYFVFNIFAVMLCLVSYKIQKNIINLHNKISPLVD